MDRATECKKQGRYAEAGLAYRQCSINLEQYAKDAKAASDPVVTQQRHTRAQAFAVLAAQMVEAAHHQGGTNLPAGIPSETPSHSSQPEQSATASQESADPWLTGDKPTDRFDDIFGLDDVKEQIRIKLIYPFTHPENARRYAIRPGGGLLLYGPPGTGKTSIARAIAGEIDAAFFAVMPSTMLTKWLGGAEQNVAQLFAAAHQHQRSVIYIDEVEALLPRRKEDMHDAMKRVVAQFLQELDGVTKHEGTLLFVGATNHPWLIDLAAMRPGRFDSKILVPLPDWAVRRAMISRFMEVPPIAPDVSLDELTTRLDGYSGADIAQVCEVACETPFVDSVQTDVLRDVNKADFDAAFARVKPSVSTAAVEQYDRYANGQMID